MFWLPCKMHFYWFKSPLVLWGLHGQPWSLSWPEVVRKCDSITGQEGWLPACLCWQHALLFGKEEHGGSRLQTLGRLIIIVLKIRLPATVTTTERGKGSSLPFPCLCACFKLRFLSLLCILADTLSMVFLELLEHSVKQLPSLAAYQF